VDTQTRRVHVRVPLLAGLLAIVAAFAGSASMSDRSAAASAARVDAHALTRTAADFPPAQRSNAAGTPVASPALVPLIDGIGARRKARCTGCGVVESVRRVDRREIAGGVCSTAEFDRLQIPGHAHDADSGASATLSDTIEGVLAGRPAAGKATVSSSYQIVVRFRDGSRHVFNEAAARSWQSGEHVQVIAGADLPAE